jgi:SagB-type dehydrogenase family enzyme
MTTVSHPGDLFEILHDATKLVPGHDEAFRSRVGFYNSSEEGRDYIASAYKKYVGYPEVELTAAALPSSAISDCLLKRTSVRKFSGEPVSIEDLSTLLHLAYGSDRGSSGEATGFVLPKRPYPAAGGLYSIECYPILLRTTGIASGVCHYSRYEQKLRKLAEAPAVKALRDIFNIPEALADSAGMAIVHTSNPQRVSKKYGLRGRHFAAVEMGLATQSLLVAATAVNLSSVVWGGYYDREVEDLLGIDGIEETVATVTFVGKE